MSHCDSVEESKSESNLLPGTTTSLASQDSHEQDEAFAVNEELTSSRTDLLHTTYELSKTRWVIYGALVTRGTLEGFVSKVHIAMSDVGFPCLGALKTNYPKI